MKLLVHTYNPTPRVHYACRILFSTILGMEASVTNDWNFFVQADRPKIIYGSAPDDVDYPTIPSASLLFEDKVCPVNCEIKNIDGIPAGFFLPGNPSDLLPFDLLAFTFYLTTRYEEYLPFLADAHGRFPAKESLAFKEGFLQQPILQEWGHRLWAKLKYYYPRLPDNRPAFHFRPTYDIDMAWAYLHRPLWMQLGGFFKAVLKGQTAIYKERFRVQFRGQLDPFHSFEQLHKLHKCYNLRPLYFFLLGQRGAYDKNLPPDGDAMRRLANQLKQEVDTGIHPSYASNADAVLLNKEVRHYTRLFGTPPTRSRQHFLKLSFPNTYRQLVRAGISEDYTMGYADTIGFRAGLSLPFPWYDLEAEAEQPLMIFPFPLMDVTLKQYLQLTPEQATATTQRLIDTVKNTGGQFLPLWHNSSFAASHGWAEWDKVHEDLLRYGTC